MSRESSWKLLLNIPTKRRIKKPLTCLCFLSNFFLDLNYQMMENFGLGFTPQKQILIVRKKEVSSLKMLRTVEWWIILQNPLPQIQTLRLYFNSDKVLRKFISIEITCKYHLRTFDSTLIWTASYFCQSYLFTMEDFKFKLNPWKLWKRFPIYVLARWVKSLDYLLQDFRDAILQLEGKKKFKSSLRGSKKYSVSKC